MCLVYHSYKGKINQAEDIILLQRNKHKFSKELDYSELNLNNYLLVSTEERINFVKKA